MPAFDDWPRYVTIETGRRVGKPGQVDLQTQLRMEIEAGADALRKERPDLELDQAREMFVHELVERR